MVRLVLALLLLAAPAAAQDLIFKNGFEEGDLSAWQVPPPPPPPLIVADVGTTTWSAVREGEAWDLWPELWPALGSGYLFTQQQGYVDLVFGSWPATATLTANIPLSVSRVSIGQVPAGVFLWTSDSAYQQSFTWTGGVPTRIARGRVGTDAFPLDETIAAYACMGTPKLEGPNTRCIFIGSWSQTSGRAEVETAALELVGATYYATAHWTRTAQPNTPVSLAGGSGLILRVSGPGGSVLEDVD